MQIIRPAIIGLVGLAVLTAPSLDVAAVPTTIRASVDGSGNQGNDRSCVMQGALSSDGRYLAFMSIASNLVPVDNVTICDADNQGVPESCADIFVRDNQTGAVEMMSVDSSGIQGDHYSAAPSISADGRYVAFQSWAANLVPGDSGGSWTGEDIFVHDRQTGSTERVSVDSTGNEANNGSSNAQISGDGRYLAFDSYASNLVAGDTNVAFDVFVHDRLTGTTERVSVASGGGQSSGCQFSGCSGNGSISDDGRFVAFSSLATNLVPDDTNNNCSDYEGDPPNCADIFVHDRQTGLTERVSVDSSGTQSNGDSSEPVISGDGRYVAFWSEGNNLVGGDTNTCAPYYPVSCPDIFVHDRQTSVTERVSVSTSGNQSNGPPWGAVVISTDGRYVGFTSEATNLVSGDTNQVNDVFLRDRQAGTTTRVSVNTAGTQALGISYIGGISGDGQVVAFQSEACNLVANDSNEAHDVFLRDAAGPGGGGNTDCGSLDNLMIDAEDDAAPANTATTIGSVEPCRRIFNNDVLDGDEDSLDAVAIDVLAGPVGFPSTRPLQGFSIVLNYDNTMLRVTAKDNQMLLASAPGSSADLDLSEPVPDSDGAYDATLIDGGTPETGPGVISRITLEAVGPGFSPLTLSNVMLLDDAATNIIPKIIKSGTIIVDVGTDPLLCTDTDGDGIVDAADNCLLVSNSDQTNSDNDPLGDECDLDDDNAGVLDADEIACGGHPQIASLRPERTDGPFAGHDDDGDTQVDEPLSTATLAYDCDGDGFKGSAEDHVFGTAARANQDPCGTNGWPAELVAGSFSENKITISDLANFVVPVRHLNTDVGTYTGDVRWDLVPGSTFGSDINISDMAALTVGPSAFPPMLHGVRAFGGPACPWAP